MKIFIVILLMLCMLPTVIAQFDSSCSETDGGNNPYVQGTTTSKRGDTEPTSSTDYCQAPTMLREYYCAGHLMEPYRDIAYHPCSCVNGACLTQCNDGADNDGDGDIDSADSGCTETVDHDETNCDDGVCEGGETYADCPEDCTCATLDGTCCDPVDSCDTPISGTECNCCSGECIACQPETETCDGLDNDCDESIDEDFDFTSDDSNCGECGIECSDTQGCIDSVCVECTDEICDGLDNDCDGTPDNGFDFDNDAQNCGDCDVICPGLCNNGECVYHDADEDDSGDISITELGSYLDDWKSGLVSIIEFLDAANIWKE